MPNLKGPEYDYLRRARLTQADIERGHNRGAAREDLSSPARQGKFAVVMREFSTGKLRSSSGQKVTNPAQAKAIAASEASEL